MSEKLAIHAVVDVERLTMKYTGNFYVYAYIIKSRLDLIT